MPDSAAEVIAALVNLIEVLENGRDLRDDLCPEPLQAIEKVRLVIVTVANPEGCIRVKPPSMIAAPTSNRGIGRRTHGWMDPSAVDLTANIVIPSRRTQSYCAVISTTTE